MSEGDHARPPGRWPAGISIELQDDERMIEIAQKIERATGKHTLIRGTNSRDIDVVPNKNSVALADYSTAELEHLLDMLEAMLRTLH
jgi:hypothetical protein